MIFKEEIFKEILLFGKSKYPNPVDPSKNEILFNAGTPLVTTHLEELSKFGFIKNVFPIFGNNGGMWLSYSLSEEGYKVANDINTLKEYLKHLYPKPTNEVSDAIRNLIKIAEETNINENYKDDFLKTLDEIAKCFDNECYIATISLCGKILETTIHEIFKRNNIETREREFLSNMIERLMNNRENVDDYIDPSLPQIAKIISYSRNGAIHHNERVPIPSRDQAIMVIFALRDIVNRNLSKK